MPEEPPRRVYNWTPLREVSFEIRFPAKLRIEKEIHEFQEEVEDTFPVVREGTHEESGRKTWEFIDDEGTLKLRVLNDTLVLMDESHESYEELKSYVQTFVTIFTERFDIQDLRRMGLRYLNNYHFQTENHSEEYAEFFTPVFNPDFYDGEDIMNFMFQGRFERDAHFLTVRNGVVGLPPNNPDQFVYLLDMDAYALESLEFDSLLDRLDELHDDIYSHFHEHISDAFIKILEEGPQTGTG